MRSKRNTNTLFTSALLLLLALSVQGCFGFGGGAPPNSNTITTNSSGKQVSVTQNLFKGKIYFTIDHNLWVITGDNKSTQLLGGGDIYDPAVSPDGKWIAYVVMYKDYSDLMVMPSTGGPSKKLLTAMAISTSIADSPKIPTTGLWNLPGRLMARISCS